MKFLGAKGGERVCGTPPFILIFMIIRLLRVRDAIR
jgi:hypothetical protein